MREELLLARSSLLASGDSAKVESVIRLLEQTYERLDKLDTEDRDEVTVQTTKANDFVRTMVSLS